MATATSGYRALLYRAMTESKLSVMFASLSEVKGRNWEETGRDGTTVSGSIGTVGLCSVQMHRNLLPHIQDEVFVHGVTSRMAVLIFKVMSQKWPYYLVKWIYFSFI
jgi:hypothetical protein